MKNVICPIVALCLAAAACLLPADAKPIVVGVSDNCRRPPNVASTYYLDALAEAGHVPVLIAHCTDEARLDEVLSRIDLLLMTGGEDVDPARYAETNSASHVNAERDRFDFALMSCAVRRRLPIFGICRGNQLVNVFSEDLSSRTSRRSTCRRRASPYAATASGRGRRTR
jgi:putative glutamine amidotransferase